MRVHSGAGTKRMHGPRTTEPPRVVRPTPKERRPRRASPFSEVTDVRASEVTGKDTVLVTTMKTDY